MSDGKGYLTPDPPDPPGVICIKVFIPDDKLYVAAFWGAYQFMTNWNAWARDPLKKGREAARVWKRAFEMSRAHWEIFKGDCGDMIDNLRTKPLNPCILQAKNDDGEWEDIFDAGCCGGGGGGCGEQLRLSGDTIERYDPSCDCWKPAGPATPPSEIVNTTPPFQPSSDGACIAATNFGSLIEGKKNTMAVAVGDVLNFGAWVLVAFDLVAEFFDVTHIFQVLSLGLTALYAELQDNYAEVGAFDIEDRSICIALAHYKNDGTMDQTGVDAMLADINTEIALYAVDDAEATAWRYVYSWVKSAGPQGMSMVSTWEGITEGACEDCPWSYTFDFRASPQGFARGDYDGNPLLNPGGQYVPGQGWKTQIIGDRPFCWVRFGIERSEITGYTFDYTGVRSGVGADDFNFITVPGADVTNAWINGSEVLHYDYDISPDLDYVEFRLDAYAGESHPDCSCVVHKLTVFGRGVNPFTAALPPV